MTTGECSASEYQSMLSEKMRAMQQAGCALAGGGDAEAVLRPFHKRATANAKRLRKG
jgi:hypothetical protein